MSDLQYTQYKNLHIFAEKWRKYINKSSIYDNDTFRKHMQTDQYVKLDYQSVNGKPVLIYLFAKDSKYNSSQDLKRLLSKIKEPSDVIIVSDAPLKTYSIRAIQTFKHLRVKTYLHENFDLIIPQGPLCYPHRILSHEEVDRLLNNELCCGLINLPKILLEDVQCIWIGAEVGDVIEIKMLSEITGESVQYRVVIPKSGRVISFRPEQKEPITQPEQEDEDEEIQELRENAAAENIESENEDEETGSVAESNAED